MLLICILQQYCYKFKLTFLQTTGVQVCYILVSMHGEHHSLANKTTCGLP